MQLMMSLILDLKWILQLSSTFYLKCKLLSISLFENRFKQYVTFLSWINSSNIKAVCSIRNKIYFVNLHVASCLKTIQVGNRKWFPRNINLTFCFESGTMFVVIAFGICLDSNFTSNSWPFQGVCKITLHLHHWILIYFWRTVE